MKKSFKLIVMLITVISLTLPSGLTSYASPLPAFSDTLISPMSVGIISTTASRTTSTSGKVTASGALTMLADSITTTATLYEYNSTTGTLSNSGVSPITKTEYNCSSYNFQATFPLQASKQYKVKLVVKDISGGRTTSATTYSNVF